MDSERVNGLARCQDVYVCSKQKAWWGAFTESLCKVRAKVSRLKLAWFQDIYFIYCGLQLTTSTMFHLMLPAWKDDAIA